MMVLQLANTPLASANSVWGSAMTEKVGSISSSKDKLKILKQDRHLLFRSHRGLISASKVRHRPILYWAPRSRHRDAAGQVKVCEERSDATVP